MSPPAKNRQPSPPDPLAFGLTADRLDRERKDKQRSATLSSQAFRLGCFVFVILLPLSVASAVFVASRVAGSGGNEVLLTRSAGIAVAMLVGLWGGLVVRSLSREASRLRRPLPEQAAFDAALKHYQQSNRAYWTTMDPRKFEWRLAQLLNELDPSIPAIPTRGSGDGGIDIWIPAAKDPEARRLAFARHPLPSSGTVLVQCKRYFNPCGPEAVRALLGVMVHEKAEGGILVALGGFTKGTQRFADGKPIALWDVDVVLDLHEQARSRAVRAAEAEARGDRESPSATKSRSPKSGRELREVTCALVVFAILVSVFAILIRWAFFR